jgi:predicted enzyme related to lactoylglutathione lyase
MTTRFAHVNLIARDWRRLADFYQQVFGCVPVPPRRDLSGEWLDQATGIAGVCITGLHLRLPGMEGQGPTLEIFQYDPMAAADPPEPNRPGFGHIAFAVADVAAAGRSIVQNGGSPLGRLTKHDVPGVGRLTFQYLRDPEGNIIEIQNWRKG